MMRRPYKPIIKMHNRNCSFCDNKTKPDYKESSVLNNFITERGKIISRARTGICSKHQRQLSRAIKRARIIGLMPFVVKAS